jgi:hypothetical protein
VLTVLSPRYRKLAGKNKKYTNRNKAKQHELERQGIVHKDNAYQHQRNQIANDGSR